MWFLLSLSYSFAYFFSSLRYFGTSIIFSLFHILFFFFISCILSLHGILIGWFARDPSVLHRVGHALLQLNAVEPRRARRLIFADDLFQLSKVPKQKTECVISKAIGNLSGCKLWGPIIFLDMILLN